MTTTCIAKLGNLCVGARFLALTLILLSTGCGLVGAVDRNWQETNNILRDTRRQLADESKNWRPTLEKAVDDLRTKHQYEMANQLDAIVQRGVAAAGIELRCGADFLGHRVRQAFQRVFDRFLLRSAPI